MGLFDDLNINSSLEHNGESLFQKGDNNGSENEYNFNVGSKDLFTNRRKLQLKSLRILKKGGHKDQYIRNFDIKLGNKEMVEIENLLATKRRKNKENVNGLDISFAVPNLLDVNQAPSSRADIANDWSAERDIFMLEMVEKGTTGFSETVYYIQGYTDYNGITLSGNIDLNMKFFMNTIMVFMRQRNLGTGTVVTKMSSYFSVLHSDGNTQGLRLKNVGEDFGLNDDMLIASRPEDIIGTLETRAIFDGSDVDVVPPNVIRANERSVDAPVLARKGDSTPISHLTTTVDGLLSAGTLSDENYKRSDMLDLANTRIRMNTQSEIEFLRQLSNNSSSGEKSYFTLSELSLIDNTINPDRDDRIAFITSSNKDMIKINKMDFTISEDFFRPTEENRINSIVSNAMTSLLSETGLEFLAFSFDNDFNAFNVSIIGYKTSIEGWDARKLALYASEKFKAEVMNNVTRSNQIHLMGVVTASLMDDTRVSINIGNGMVDFINPTFADSLFSNNISDSNAYKNLARGYDKIVDVVTAMM